MASTQDFFSCLPTEKAVASVASSVLVPRTISSSGSTATGLKKWKPTTRSGCASCEPISLIDSEEVFVARMAFSGVAASSSEKILRLRSMSSGTASMTKSTSLKPS